MGQTLVICWRILQGNLGVGWWRNWFWMLLHLDITVLSLRSSWIVITMESSLMGMHLSAHSQQTKSRLMYYAFLNTLSLLSHSVSYISSCNCVQMKQRNGMIAQWWKVSTLRWIESQRRLSRLPNAPGNSSKVLFHMNKYGLQWEGKRLQVPFSWNWRNYGAVLPLKSSLTKKGLSSVHILIQYGGLDTIGLPPAIPKCSAYSSPSKFLDGAAANQSFHSGRKMSEINALNVDMTMRIQNTLHDAETRFEFSNSTIQSKPSWTSWTMQRLFPS